MKGYAARMLAARRPRQPILAVSNDPIAARSFNILPGTKGIHGDVAFTTDSTDHVVECLRLLWKKGEINNDDLVFVASVGYPKPGNLMNLLQTHHVRDLVDALGWGTQNCTYIKKPNVKT